MVPDWVHFRDTGLYIPYKYSQEKEIVDQIFQQREIFKKSPQILKKKSTYKKSRQIAVEEGYRQTSSECSFGFSLKKFYMGNLFLMTAYIYTWSSSVVVFFSSSP